MTSRSATPPVAADPLAQEVAAAAHVPAGAPATAVVASAPAARRLAATGTAALTFEQLVERLGGPELAARRLRPASPAAVRAVLRAVAVESDGPAASSARSDAGLAALHRQHQALRRSSDETLDVLGHQPGHGGDVVRLLAATRARLHDLGLADELDLRQAALAAARRGESRHRLGALVLLQRPPAPSVEADLFAALAEHGARWAVVAAPSMPCTDVVQCQDPEHEARTAVRMVLAAAGAGVALGEVAVLHPPGQGAPLRRVLRAAGVPSWPVTSRRPADSAAGRALSALLELPDRRWDRLAVAGALAAAPVTTSDGRLAPVARWSALAAEAGVEQGLGAWRDRLALLGARRPEVAADAVGLAALVGELAALTSMPPSAGYGAWARGAEAVLARFLAPSPDAPWPDEELAALAAVGRVLDDLAGLDAVTGPVDRRTFVAALRTELAAASALEHQGTVDDAGAAVRGAVFVGSYPEAAGMAFDAVVATGLGASVMDGAVEAGLPDELCLADPTGTLATRARRQAELGAAVHSALAGGRTVRAATWATVGPRGEGPERPWSGLGAVVDGATRRRRVASPARELRGDGPVLHAGELRLRALDAAHRLGGDVGRAAPVAASTRLAAGIDLVRGRGSRAWSRFDGRTAPGSRSGAAGSGPMSATRLETYAECPRRYFFARMLGVEDHSEPEDLWRIEARRRGTLVHLILERYVVARLAGAPRSLQGLLDVAEACFDEAAAVGRVGHRVPWQVERAAIVRDLCAFYAEEPDGEPLAAELPFGDDDIGGDCPPLELELGDGRVVLLRGRIDRVDGEPGGQLLVSDYKTGRQAGLAQPGVDPLAGGRRLQLPLYALAAAARFGAAGPVRARYWMVSAERAARATEIVVDADVERRLRDVVGRIVDGIDAGAFPGIPGPNVPGGFMHCRWCDFDRVCPAGRGRQWAAKRADPALGVVARMLAAAPAEPGDAEDLSGAPAAELPGATAS